MYHNGSDVHTHQLKQQFSYTLAWMWIGWTHTSFACRAGEDNILYNLVSLCIGATELVDSCVNFGTFQVQQINREAEISKTKLMQIIMALCYSAWC